MDGNLGKAGLYNLIRFFPFVLSLISIGSWLVGLRKGYYKLYGSLWIWISVYGVIVLMSCLTSYDPLKSFSKVIYYLVTGELLCLCISSANLKRSTLKKMIYVGMTVCGGVSLIGCIENIFGFLLFENLYSTSTDIFYNRIVATVGNPNPLGTYLALFLPFFVVVALFTSPMLNKILGFVGLICSMTALFFCYSKGAWINWFFSSFILLWNSKRKYIGILVSIVLLMFIIAYMTEKIENPYEEYISKYQTEHRINSLHFSTIIWNYRPLFGSGTGSFEYNARPLGLNFRNDTPDNMFFLILAETGIMGFILKIGLFSVMILSLGKITGRIEKCNSVIQTYSIEKFDNYLIPLALIASLFGCMVNMVTWDVLYFPLTRTAFWIMAGIGMAYACEVE